MLAKVRADRYIFNNHSEKSCREDFEEIMSELRDRDCWSGCCWGRGTARQLATAAELIISPGRGGAAAGGATSARSDKDRGFDAAGLAFEADALALAARDDVDVVVELIGGAVRGCV